MMLTSYSTRLDDTRVLCSHLSIIQFFEPYSNSWMILKWLHNTRWWPISWLLQAQNGCRRLKMAATDSNDCGRTESSAAILMNLYYLLEKYKPNGMSFRQLATICMPRYSRLYFYHILFVCTLFRCPGGSIGLGPTCDTNRTSTHPHVAYKIESHHSHHGWIAALLCCLIFLGFLVLALVYFCRRRSVVFLSVTLIIMVLPLYWSATTLMI